MNSHLQTVFRATSYRVDAPEACFILRIGLLAPDFDDYLRRQRIANWGIVSAYNPMALPCAEAENQRRQQDLQAQIKALGWRFLSGVNLADAGDWPPEASCVLLAVNEAQTCTLGRAFCQTAVVCGDSGSAPRLVFIPYE
jgi:hypothetical protein